MAANPRYKKKVYMGFTYTEFNMQYKEEKIRNFALERKI